jgi:hypothetical protein
VYTGAEVQNHHWTSSFSAQANVYQHPAYGQAYPGFVVAHWQANNGEIWHPVTVAPIPSQPDLQVAETPYGVGGPVVVGQPDKADFWQAWQTWCHSHTVIAELVRFDPLQQNHKPWQGVITQVATKPTYWVDTTRPVTLSNRCSRNVRKATSNGLRVTYQQWTVEWPLFMVTYHQLMASKVGGYRYCWPNTTMSLLRQFGENGFGVLQGLWHDELGYLGGTLFLTYGGCAYYHLGAITPEGKRLKGSNLALAAMLDYCHRHGQKRCFLGGGLTTGDSLDAFKAQFSHEPPLPYVIGRHIHVPAAYHTLREQAGQPLDCPVMFWHYQ